MSTNRWILTLLVAIVSLFVGYQLNVLANKRSNAELIKLIKEELAQLNQQQSTTTRLTDIEQRQITERKAYLEGLLGFLTTKQ